jgi:glycosyltransferase involved in cell wall biosynthesis
MKITIIQGAFYPVPSIKGTSVEKFWYELGRDLAERGHEVVHISRRHPTLPNIETSRGVKYLRIVSFNSPKFHLIRIFLDFLYSCNVLFHLPCADIIVSNTFWFPILFLFRPRNRGKLMVSVDRMPRGQYKYYHAASSFRVPSMAVLNAIKDESKDAGRKCVLIPNPLPFISSNIPSLLEKKKVILYVGRIHPEKGIQLLLDSYQLACNRGLSNWRLRIIGPSDISFGGGGPEWQELLENRYRSSDYPVEWVLPIYDNVILQKEFADSSIFVYPSLAGAGEALPVAPLEAMAQGSVPIVSNLACFNDYIEHGHNGLMFEQGPFSINNLSDSILKLASDTEYRRSMAYNALEVRNSHSSTRIAGMLEAAFKSLIT